ncbi:unnamed protein product [Prunus brigantina]
MGTGFSLSLLVINKDKIESTYPFVAVEFDIYSNNYASAQDPAFNHVGIDVNSVKSNVTRPWNGSITQGQVNSAWIRYDSGWKNLSVTFTSYENGVQVRTYFDYMVDVNDILQGWVIVGFSAATGAMTALHKINSWSFNSTNAYNNTPVAPESTPIVEPKSSGSANIRLFIGLGGGGFLILVGGLCLAWFTFWKRRRVAEERDENPFVNKLIHEELGKGTGPRKFSYRELVRATSNFEEGGFGVVYGGFIKDLNSYVAVKRISSGSKQVLKEYASEVRIISRLRHRNLVQLIGWCHEKQELMLVYDFMPNGNLDSHLFKEKGLLTWQIRYSIAQGLASGLFYLHELWEQCLLHRDIKSSNVMLDSNFNAKLGDFGLARLVDHRKQSQTTIVAGTRGYMALEYVTTGKASKESDI